ncbi:MAG: ABC transporter ATP-binding protein [Proteobacteria bacterium]|nr:ABC transporter ATP-binding protein [Pseudomonadota bacterium]
MIVIRDICKTYKIFDRQLDRLKEWACFGRVKFHRDYKALSNVTLNVDVGTVYGVVGMNGAGKSTLLKILTGTAIPTSGECKLPGRVSALLELGAGFHSELTGRENVIVNGRLHGLTSEEIKNQVEEIKDFSELGEFFEQPIRTYSSGMYIRLGFAVASSVKPDILIIDEALSVGDAHFQQKCIKRIKEFKKQGMTIFFVSHDLATVKAICDKAALLDKGQIIAEGIPLIVMEKYNELISQVGISGHEYSFDRSPTKNLSKSHGNFKAIIEHVSLTDAQGKNASVVISGTAITIELTAKFHADLDNPTFGILIRDHLGNDIFGINTHGLGFRTKKYKIGQSTKVTFAMNLDLGPGDYTISTAIHAEMNHTDGNYFWEDRALAFKVLPDARLHFVGVARLKAQVTES